MRTAHPRSLQRLIAAALLAGLAGACSSAGHLGEPDAPAIKLEPTNLGRTYRLGIGDKLKVQVFGEADLSGTFEVGAAGAVSLPLIGEVPAAGRSIAEFRDAIVSRLSQGYLKNPRVTVEVTTYRPIYIHGEVRSGGEFPYKNGLKIRDAIALAGGYTYRANQSYVILTRPGGPQGVKVANTGDIDVLPGDNIQIPERFF